MRHVAIYFCVLVVFLAVDFVWLKYLMRDFYLPALAHLLADETNLIAAGAFYALYCVGITAFMAAPGYFERQSLRRVAARGALFGCVAYATYDLTNLATLRDFPLSVALVDIAWGAVITATSSTLGLALARRVLPAPP